MCKRLISLLLAICLFACLLTACSSKPEITSAQAYQLVLDQLGDKSAGATDPHIHSGEYYGAACYNIYVTVDGQQMQYIVSKYGDILHSGAAAHSH